MSSRWRRRAARVQVIVVFTTRLCAGVLRVSETVRGCGIAEPFSAGGCRGCEGVGFPRGGSGFLIASLTTSLVCLPLSKTESSTHPLRVTLHSQFFLASIRNMGLVELLGFCISIFGLYGVVQCLRFLLPCFIISSVSSILNNAEHSLAHAVTTGAIPAMNDYRVDLEMYTSCFCGHRSSS